jgi:hypothetical protein
MGFWMRTFWHDFWESVLPPEPWRSLLFLVAGIVCIVAGCMTH